jgi:hypothetical protein
MAVLNFITWETGDTRECFSTTGSFATQLNGSTYTGLATPGGSPAYFTVGGLTSAGRPTTLNTNILALEFAWRFLTAPTAPVPVVELLDTAGTAVGSIWIDPSGYQVFKDGAGNTLHINEVPLGPVTWQKWSVYAVTGTSGTLALTFGLFYGATLTVNLGTTNFGYARLGPSAAAATAPDMEFDLVVARTDVPGYVQTGTLVRVGANGTYTGFSPSTGVSKPALIDERPGDGTEYLTTAGGATYTWLPNGMRVTLLPAG